jgi:hypothetical protein
VIRGMPLNLTTPVQRRSFRKVLVGLHNNRKQLLTMTRRYPVMIDTPAGERFTLMRPEEVDEFIVAIELELAARAGEATPPLQRKASLGLCPCGCGASCEAQCWHTSDWTQDA